MEKTDHDKFKTYFESLLNWERQKKTSNKTLLLLKQRRSTNVPVSRNAVWLRLCQRCKTTTTVRFVKMSTFQNGFFVMVEIFVNVFFRHLYRTVISMMLHNCCRNSGI